MTTEAISYLASICTTLAFVPQVIHIARTRDAGAISLPMYALFTLGIALWLAYGIALASGPIIVANAVTLLLSATVLALKLHNTAARRPAPSAAERLPPRRPEEVGAFSFL